MVQKVSILMMDDLDGTPAEETVRFSLDGADYEIDLSGGHATDLRAALAAYVDNARKVPSARRRRHGGARKDLPSIREFARNRGYDVKDRGRVPAHIVDEYDRMKALTPPA